MRKPLTYTRGFLALLAREAGISLQYLSGIRAKKKVPSPEVAAKLADACAILGVSITRLELLYPHETKNKFYSV